MKNILKLKSVTTNEQIEWLRKQRNKPEQYKYFRQDRPITITEQKNWWKSLKKENHKIALFISKIGNRRIGYVGLNPINKDGTAEFGIFIIKEFSGKNHGKAALRELLRYGFEDLKLKKIYSDCLNYPGEDRFGFYKKLGFTRDYYKIKYYLKRGGIIPSIYFHMTAATWKKLKCI